MQLEQIEVIGAEAAQRGVDGTDQPGAARARLVWAGTGGQRRFRRQQHLLAPALDRRAEHFLRRAVGIHIGRVEQGDTGLQADVDQAPGLRGIGIAPRAEQRTATAEGT